MATTESLTLWYQSQGPTLTKHATSLDTAKKIYKGATSINVGGVMHPLVSGASLKALATTFIGADGNGGLVVYSKQANVRLQILGGTSKTLGVDITLANTGFVDVLLQQTTDGGGLTTSTAAQAVAALRAHPIVMSLLAVAATGTGAGLTATAAATAVPMISTMGLADDTYDNAAGVAPLTISPFMSFGAGTYRCYPNSGETFTAAQIGSKVALLNDTKTVSATLDFFNLTGTLVDVDQTGSIFVKID